MALASPNGGGATGSEAMDPLRVGLLSRACGHQGDGGGHEKACHGHGHGGQGQESPRRGHANSFCYTFSRSRDQPIDEGSPGSGVSRVSPDLGAGVGSPAAGSAGGRGAAPAVGVGVAGGGGRLVDARHLLDALERSVRWLDAHDPAECRTTSHLEVDCEQARCDHSALSETNNMLMLVRANELITMSHVNTFLAIISVFYLASNLVCAVLNSYDMDCDPKVLGCDPATTPQVFHNLEFWSACIFNTVDLLALSYSPRTLSNQYQNPFLLKLLVLFNVGLSFAGALMVTLNVEKFEVISHEMEYVNELIICIFDSMILLTLARGHGHQGNKGNDRCVTVTTLLIAGCVALAQLGVYNLSGWAPDGDSLGETPAHYLEFSFGAVSAGVTFWFTMDNKICAEKRLKQIMYGDTQRAW